MQEGRGEACPTYQVPERLGPDSLALADPNRLLCLQQYLCGMAERTQALESDSSDFQSPLASARWRLVHFTNMTLDVSNLARVAFDIYKYEPRCALPCAYTLSSAGGGGIQVNRQQKHSVLSDVMTYSVLRVLNRVT